MLHWAALNDYQRIATLLISRGVDLEAKDERYCYCYYKYCLVTPF